MGLCMALDMNSVGIPGGFRSNAAFREDLRFGGGFGRFGASKGFCANSQFEPILTHFVLKNPTSGPTSRY